MEIHTSIVVRAERTRVWETFMDTGGWVGWSPWSLCFNDGEGFKIGRDFELSTVESVVAFLKPQAHCHVSELENPSVICWTGSVLGFRGFHRFTMSDAPEGCLVTSEERFEELRSVLLRPVRALIRSQVMHFLRCLRSAAESD